MLIAVSALCSASKESFTEITVALLISSRLSSSRVTESSMSCSHSPARTEVMHNIICSVVSRLCVELFGLIIVYRVEIVRRTSIVYLISYFLLSCFGTNRVALTKAALSGCSPQPLAPVNPIKYPRNLNSAPWQQPDLFVCAAL